MLFTKRRPIMRNTLGCRERLSERIISIILILHMGNGTDEIETHRIKTTHLLTHLHYLVKTVITFQQPPVTNDTIFKNPRNNICRVLVHVKLTFVSIPKEML